MIKRLTIVFILLQGSAIWSQQTNPSTCKSERPTLATYWYAQTVWRQILPENNSTFLVVVTLSLNTESKLVLRAKDASHFELLRGTPSANVYKTLDDLD